MTPVVRSPELAQVDRESLMDRRAQTICAWSGLVVIVGFLLGGVVIGHFVPPFIHPNWGAQRVAASYAKHADRVRWGAMISMISLSFLLPWGVAVAARTRMIEGKAPVLAYLQIACVAVSTTIVVLMPMFWALAAFRAGHVSPETTRSFSDVGFFLIVWPYAPFSIWVASVGLAIVLDPNTARPIYPRWVGYFSFWNAPIYVPAGVMSFFKHGPFGWTGLFALYLPLAMFFSWMVILTVYTLQRLREG
jgi:hypothetical protein